MELPRRRTPDEVTDYIDGFEAGATAAVRHLRELEAGRLRTLQNAGDLEGHLISLIACLRATQEPPTC